MLKWILVLVIAGLHLAAFSLGALLRWRKRRDRRALLAQRAERDRLTSLAQRAGHDRHPR